jgi:hypothetical protein
MRKMQGCGDASFEAFRFKDKSNCLIGNVNYQSGFSFMFCSRMKTIRFSGE